MFRHNICYFALILALVFIAGCDSKNDDPVLENNYRIAGTVNLDGKGLAGVKISVSGAGSRTIVTDASGNYSRTGFPAGKHTVTPMLEGYKFSPESTEVNISAAIAANDSATSDADQASSNDRDNIDFTAIVDGDTAAEDSADAVAETVVTYSKITFAYNANGSINTVSLDAGKDETIDIVDYYSYDENGDLRRIERDFENDREADIFYDFTFAPDEEKVTAQSTAEAEAIKAVTVAATAAEQAKIDQEAADAAEKAAVEAEAAQKIAEDAAKNATEEEAAAKQAAAATAAANATKARAAADSAQVKADESSVASADADKAVITTAATAEAAAINVQASIKKADTARSDNLSSNVDAKTTYHYNANDQISQVDLDTNGDGTADSSSFYTYDEQSGTLLSVEFNDDNDSIMDAVTTYDYNEAGKIQTITSDDNYDGTAEAVYWFFYEDEAGNNTRIERHDASGAINAATSYTYDVNNQLLSIEQDHVFPQVINSNIGLPDIELF